VTAIIPDQVQAFDNWADNYDRTVQAQSGFPFAGYEEVLDRVTALTNAQAGHHVLDLGIGTGNLAKRFVDIGCRVSGIDGSPRMLELVREKLPGVRVAEADLAGPWPAEFGGRFDRIVSTYALHHCDLQRKIALLQQLVEKHLSPGGLIVVGDICFPTAQSLNDARTLAGDQWDDSEFYWTVPETIAACEIAGHSVRCVPVSNCAAVFVFGPFGELDRASRQGVNLPE